MLQPLKWLYYINDLEFKINLIYLILDLGAVLQFIHSLNQAGSQLAPPGIMQKKE